MEPLASEGGGRIEEGSECRPRLNFISISIRDVPLSGFFGS